MNFNKIIYSVTISLCGLMLLTDSAFALSPSSTLTDTKPVKLTTGTKDGFDKEVTEPVAVILVSEDADTNDSVTQALSKKYPTRINAPKADKGKIFDKEDLSINDTTDILLFSASTKQELNALRATLGGLNIFSPKIIFIGKADADKNILLAQTKADAHIFTDVKDDTATKLENLLYQTSMLYPPAIDYYDTAAVTLNMPYNKKVANRSVWDRGKGLWLMDDKPIDRNQVESKIPCTDLLSPQIKEGKSFSAYSYGNLYHNEWFLIYNGETNQIISRAHEPFLRRQYTMLVVWKDGHLSSEKIRFAKKNDGSYAVMLNDSDKNYADEIKFSFFGQRLIHQGKKVPLEQMYAQFDDMYHLYFFPQFITYREDGSPIYGVSFGEKELFGKLSMDTDEADYKRDALLKVIENDGLFSLDLKTYFKEGLSEKDAIADIKENALHNRGYSENPNGAQNEGDYKIEGTTLTVKLISTKYPHNLVGISASGKLVCINLIGDKSKDLGYTIKSAQDKIIQETKDDPVTEVFLLANSKDVFKYTDKGLSLKESAEAPYPTLSSMFVVTDNQVPDNIGIKKAVVDIESAA